MLVFYGELDRALNPELFRTGEVGTRLSIGELVTRAEHTQPGAYVTYLDLPDESRGTALVGFAPRPGSEVQIPDGLQVYFDPVSGAALGERQFGSFRLDRRHLAPFLYRLHMDLHLGRVMVWLLGAVALGWTLDHAVAVALSFPVPSRWRQSFAIPLSPRQSAFPYRLHRALGLWLVPVTFTLAVSGLYFNFYEQFRRVVDLVSPLTPPVSADAAEESARSALPASEGVALLDRAVDRVGRHAPGRAIDSVTFDPAHDRLTFRLFDARDAADYGERLVTLSTLDGAVLADVHPAAGSAGDRFLEWQYPLHSGKAFGWAGRLLIFAAGLVVAALTLTGYLLWWRKLRGRRRLALGAAERSG